MNKDKSTGVVSCLFFVYIIISISVDVRGKVNNRICLSSDAEFEVIYQSLNNSEPPGVQIQDWDWHKPIIKRCTGKSKKFDLNLTDDGYLIAHGVFYPPEDFCIDVKEGTARLCDSRKSTIAKCCPADEIWDLETHGCKRTPIPFRPRLTNTTETDTTLPFQTLSTNLTHIGDTETLHPLVCPEGFALNFYSEDACPSMSTSFLGSLGARVIGYQSDSVDCPHKEKYETCRFQVTKSGISYETSSGLFYRKSGMKQILHQQNQLHCVDGYFTNILCYLVNPATDNPNIQVECANSLKNILIFCEPAATSATLTSPEEEQSPEKAYCLTAIWLSTCPLLLSAAVANFLIIQKNVHGWTLSCYLMSMFFVNINSAVLALEDKAFGCRVIDFSMKFLYLSTLCWMTSINFGLWRTFRVTLPTPVVQPPHRFIFNLIFSLTVPAIVVVISYYAAQGDSCDNQYCALYSHATIPYYSGPVIFFILVNLGLFIRTSLIIAGLRNETSSVLKKEPSGNRNMQVESFRLFTKLFLMTGSIWIIRVVLLFLQLKGLYFTWYGVLLEAVFSVPEAAFSIVVLVQPEFKKWAWGKYPSLSRKLSGLIPCFNYVPTTSLELGTKSTYSTHTSKSPTTSARIT